MHTNNKSHIYIRKVATARQSLHLPRAVRLHSFSGQRRQTPPKIYTRCGSMAACLPDSTWISKLNGLFPFHALETTAPSSNASPRGAAALYPYPTASPPQRHVICLRPTRAYPYTTQSSFPPAPQNEKEFPLITENPSTQVALPHVFLMFAAASLALRGTSGREQHAYP